MRPLPQPGQQAMPDEESYIITSSSNVSILVKLRDIVLTLLLWGWFFYMVQDFFVFAGDVYHWLHDGTGPAKSYPKLRIFTTLQDYGLSLAIFTAFFIAWPIYNRLRFRNKKRRRAAQPVTPVDMSEMYNIDPDQLRIWQDARSLTTHLDGDGHVTGVEVVRQT